MKKITLFLVAASISQFAKAQVWDINLIALPPSDSANIGTSSPHGINFYTNNSQKMSLGTNGVLKLNTLSGIGNRFLQSDASGNLIPWSGSIMNKDYQLFGDGNWRLGPVLVDANNSLHTAPNTKLGIGNANPIAELDVSGNFNLSQNQLIGGELSIGTLTDNVALAYTPSTATYPALLTFRGPSGTTVRDPLNPNTSPDPQPNVLCTDGDVHVVNSFQNVLSVQNLIGATNTGGQILLGHNGAKAFIETGGTGTGGLNHPGDLFINYNCGRNVHVFTNGSSPNPFGNGNNKIMAIGGQVNVAYNMQVGVPGATTFVDNSSQVYVHSVGTQYGIRVKHGGASGVGVKVLELSDSELAFGVYKGVSTNEFDRFTVQGDGKTVLNCTNTDAFTIKDAGNSSVVKFKVNTTGKTTITTSDVDAFMVEDAGNSSLVKFKINTTGKTTITASDVDAFIVRDATNSNNINFKVKSSGYVYAREINVMPVNITFPDYVFAKNYQLKSIENLEAFINVNKHLPNIPSAKEVEKEGLNIGEMQVKQLEKIEEAFLYIIQLKRQNDELSKRLDNLENH